MVKEASKTKMKIDTIISGWASAQKAGAYLPCPRCGMVRMRPDLYSNAFSRRANIYICDQCGTAEAVEDYQNTSHKLPVEGWFVCKTVFNQPYTEKYDDGSYVFTASQEVTIRKRDIEAILSIAFEGHATMSWCAGVETENPLSSRASEHIAQGGIATLYEIEGGKFSLDADKLARGIHQWYLEGHDSYGAINCGEIDTSEIDDEAADAIVQYAVFSELVYG